MCILNRIQIWPKDVILHIFQGTPRVPPISMHPICATICVSEHVLRGAHDKRITIK
jgi:hypothetical protein